MSKPFSLEAVAAARAAQAAYPAAPASVTLAQYRLESGDGAHVPPRSNNPFGVKATSGKPYVTAETSEVVHGQTARVQAAFRAYGSLEEAFLDHARLLATAAPYAAARAALPNLGRYVELMAARYATDPKYAAKLLAIIHEGDLTRFDAPAPEKGEARSPVAAPAARVVAATAKAAPAALPAVTVGAGAVTVAAGAAGALPPHWVVNLAPLVDQVVIPTVTTVLLTLVAAYVPGLIRCVSAWLGVRVTAAQAQVIENAINNGINLAAHKVGVVLDANASVDVKNQAVAVALTYALPKVSGEMAALGMDPASLAERIMARLPAASPGTGSPGS